VSTAPTALRRNLLTVGLFALLSAIWSWPLLSSPGGLHVHRQFDQYCTAWVATLGAHWSGDLSTVMASWPVGQGLQRLDSLVLFLLSRLVGSVIGPWTLLGLFALIGPVLSAWAAERFAARVLGARWPWSLVAGVTYGFSGMAATSLLEGHVYPLLNPWLPLLAWQWHRATARDGHWRHGLASGGLWILCLFTSAYTGIAASLWIAAWGLQARRNWPHTLRPVVAAAAVAVPVGLAYTVFFFTADGASRAADAFGPETMSRGMGSGFGSLAAMAGPLPGTDMLSHSIAPALGFLPLALVVLSSRLRPRAGPWKACLILGGVALVVALGPPGRHWFEPGYESPFLRDLGSWGPLSYFRFPVRMAWVTALAWGGVSAAVLSRLAEERPRATWLLPVAALDVLLVTGMPGRTAHTPWEVPSAYRSANPSGAVLALLPEFGGPSIGAEQILNDLECAYQIDHGRPILNVCMENTRRAGPRWRVGSWLRTALLREDTDREIRWRMASLGIGSVAWRPDLFFPADRQAIGDGLVRVFGAPAAVSTDGGEHIVLFVAQDDPAPQEVAAEQWWGW